MFWYHLTSGNEHSAIEISRLRPSDDGAKRYQNSAALRSFDSVLLFQISHFLTYDFFLRSG